MFLAYLLKVSIIFLLYGSKIDPVSKEVNQKVIGMFEATPV